MIVLTPDKQSRFAVEPGEDDLVRLRGQRLPHERRASQKAPLLPEIRAGASAPVMNAKRVPEQLNALLLHDIFLHRSMEKLNRTLQHTKGYVAFCLPDTYVWVCAQAESQCWGLHTHTQ